MPTGQHSTSVNSTPDGVVPDASVHVRAIRSASLSSFVARNAIVTSVDGAVVVVAAMMARFVDDVDNVDNVAGLEVVAGAVARAWRPMTPHSVDVCCPSSDLQYCRNNPAWNRSCASVSPAKRLGLASGIAPSVPWKTPAARIALNSSRCSRGARACGSASRVRRCDRGAWPKAPPACSRVT